MPIRDRTLDDIGRKVEAGRRISEEECLRLFASNDLISIGMMADTVRRRLNGDNAYYIRNQHINYSNVCGNGCRFCAFGKEALEDGAYELSLDEIVDKARGRDFGNR